MPPIIPQLTGLCAVITFLLSYQQKKRRNIILMNVTSRVLYIAQYLMLGAFAGAVLDVLGMVSSILAEKKHTPWVQKHVRTVFVAINTAILVAGLALCSVSRNVLDLFPIVGVLLHTIAFWITDEKIIRRVSLLGSPFWLIYNFLSRAYGSAIGDVLTMVSIVTAMIKFRNQKESDHV